MRRHHSTPLKLRGGSSEGEGDKGRPCLGRFLGERARGVGRGAAASGWKLGGGNPGWHPPTALEAHPSSRQSVTGGSVLTTVTQASVTPVSRNILRLFGCSLRWFGWWEVEPRSGRLSPPQGAVTGAEEDSFAPGMRHDPRPAWHWGPRGERALGGVGGDGAVCAHRWDCRY